jgi:hypothetical protein
MKINPIKLLAILGLMVLLITPVLAQTNMMMDIETQPANENLDDLATKLNNPVAELVSVPLQNNFDFGGGFHNHGFQYKLNVQPVIPFGLGDKWTLITRTIIPFISQNDRVGNTSQTGLGDTTLSLFFSPKAGGPGGMIWGVGPDIYLPTATEAALGAQKLGAGPTGLMLWQKQGWTYGILAAQIWSFAGDDHRQNLDLTSLQPFLAYQTKTQTTFGVNLESSYDWENTQWTVPANAMITQLVRIGKMPVSFQIGARCYAVRPSGGPNWGLRFSVTFVFPK